MQKLPVRTDALPKPFVGGSLQEMLNPNMPVLPNDFVKTFNEELNTVQDEIVLTVSFIKWFLQQALTCLSRHNNVERAP